MTTAADIQTPSDAVAVLSEGCYVDTLKADKAIAWIEKNLPISLYQWQRSALWRYFAWRRADGGYRFTKVHIWIPKKNGKSLLASVIAGFKLFELKHKRIYSGAYCAKQAALVMQGLIDLCKQSPTLRPLMKKRTGKLKAFCTKFRRDITCELTDSRYEALADGVSSNDGIIGDVVIIDEIHRMKQAQIDVLMGATSKIPDALTVVISTAGSGDKTHRAWQIYADDKAILAGDVIDTRTLAVIHEHPDPAGLKGEEIYSLEQVVLANPVLQEDSAKRELAASECEENRRLRRDTWWRRFQLGQWLAEDGEAYIDAATYEAAQVEKAPDLAGAEVFVGADKSDGAWDFSAITFLFLLPDGRVFVRHFTFAHADRIKDMGERDDRDYAGYVDAGELILIPAEAVTDAWLYEWCERQFDGLNVRQIAADPHGASYLLERWKADGRDAVAVQQSHNRMLTPVIEDYATRLRQGRIIHCRNDLYAWQLSCARCITTAKDTKKIVKAGTSATGRGGTGHIDNIDALLNALAAMRAAEIERAAYQDAGVAVVA